MRFRISIQQMATSRLLIVAILMAAYSWSHTDSAVTTSRCPVKCICTMSTYNLVIDCSRRTHDNPDVLSDEINKLLSSREYADLTSLTINNTSLTDVPQSICNLSQLKDLDLTSNQLRQLPTDCFARLVKLQKITAFGNRIVELKNGVFGGLHELYYIQLSRNRIASIGSQVFSPQHNIGFVDLRDNNLTVLDAWPLRLMEKPLKKQIRLRLTNNNISKFTNHNGHRFNCSSPRTGLWLNLAFNQIQHVVDLFKGWNVTTQAVRCLANATDPTRLALNLSDNPLNCDCKDYALYALDFNVTSIYRGATCRSPPSLINQFVNQIPLEQFVCNIIDDCPKQCRCAYCPQNVTLAVDCYASNLFVVPHKLPSLPNDASARYTLNISRSTNIRNLTRQSYMNKMAGLDASHCRIANVTVDAWKAILSMWRVRLDNNRLTSMPVEVAKQYVVTKQLVLGYNPWACTCGNSWMHRWMNVHKPIIAEPATIYCMSPPRLAKRPMLYVDEEDFCTDPATRKLIEFAIAFTAVLCSIALIVVAATCAAHRLRLKLFVRWKFHPFDRDECDGEDMDNDVFLCCSSEDYRPDAYSLVDMLEACGYKVCFHERDFQPGDTIENNMSRAIERSKRTLCLMTIHFIHSPYCMREFEVALHHNVTVLRKKRLIVLMKFPNPQAAFCRPGANSSPPDGGSTLVTDSLRQYLRQYTYVDYTAPDWTNRLLYALPINGLATNNDEDDADEKAPLLKVL